MVAKVLVAVFVVLIALLGIQRLWSNYSEKERIHSGRVKMAAEEARSKGKKETHISAPIPLYAAVSGVDEALTQYTALIVRPIAKHSQLSADSKEIETWHKLQIIDYLSSPKTSSPCQSCASPGEIPSELQPLTENELVVVRNTGDLTIDGISVRSTTSLFPEFEKNREYLVFLSIDPNSRVGSIKLGPTGVLLIDPDGQIKPISDQNRKLSDELISRYGNIKDIKEQLKFRRFPQ